MAPARRNDRPPYDDSEVAASRPLRLDEVEALLLDGGRIFERDRGRVVHLLQRIGVTIRDHHRRQTELNDDMDRLRAVQQDLAHPLNRATEALAALSPEEQRQLLDVNYLAALERLEQDRAAADQARLLAVNDINRVRLLVGTLTADATMPAEVRARLEAMLSQLNAMRSGSN
jgi:hypothetical protein